MSCKHVTRWMHDIVGRAGVSAHAERRPVACIWPLWECNWTSGHRICQKAYTHVQHRNCESGLAKACCTQAGPTHTAGHVEMAWTDESYLFWHALPLAPIAVTRRDPSPVTGTVSQATKTNDIDRLPCGYLYHSRHRIGNSTSSIRPCCCNRGGRLPMVTSSTAMLSPSHFSVYTWRKTHKIRARSELR